MPYYLQRALIALANGRGYQAEYVPHESAVAIRRPRMDRIRGKHTALFFCQTHDDAYRAMEGR